MIRRGVLIVGGLLVALGIVLVAWPGALTQVTTAVQRTVAGLLPSSDATLPSVINVHAPSGAPRSTQSVLAGQPSPGLTTSVPPAAPPYGGPTVFSPPVYAYSSPAPSPAPAPAPSAETGGDRHGGRPSPSPSGSSGGGGG